MVITGSFTNKYISSEWPKKIVGDKVIIPTKKSYIFKRSV